MKKLIILDYFFGEGIGHFERYDLSILQEAIGQGVDAQIWCPSSTECETFDHVRPILQAPSRRSWKDKPVLKRLLLKAISLLPRSAEIRKIFKDQTDNNSVILIPEIENFFYLYLIPLCLGTIGLTIKPKIVIIIRRDLNRDWGFVAYFLPLLCRVLTTFSMNCLSKRKNVYFVSDSELITEEMKGWGIVKISTVPIPHLPPRHDRETPEEKNVVIGYFGGARFEQGFDLMPATIKGAWEAYPDHSISFIVQTGHENGAGPMGAVVAELSGLKELHPDKIELLSGYLTSEKYEEQMSRCHIILIPYRREDYGSRTSGILTEAIACGAWSIVPSGTWMAKQKEKYEKIMTFDELDTKTLIDAVGLCLKLNKEIDAADKINRQIDNWYAFHSPSNYLDAIRSLSIEPPDTARHI